MFLCGRFLILGSVAVALLPGRAWAQPATPEEAKSALLVLDHLPHQPTHDRIQVKSYDFKQLGAESVYQLFVSSKYDARKPAPFILLLHCLLCPPDKFIRSTDLTELAEQRGYNVAAPMGVNLHGWYGARGNTIVQGPTDRDGRA